MERTSRTERMGAFEAECRKRGLALTIQRRAVFEELAGRRDHPTADQVYDALSRRLPGLSRTTVYRVLDTLVAHSLALKVPHAGPAARFDAVVERHHHLICDGCGELVDLPDAALGRVPLPDTRATGFEVHDYSVGFRGLCRNCR